ncbi:MAG TPA: AAA family ATPase, partial [Treponemataceae bacterium]|nr:AAA family ATPase [Treponemataceae bacterium]
MRPEKLIIRNIGPFQGIHTVDFAALGDIFLVCGKTGAGKTTVFDAISFAFYGDASGERKGISK